MVPALKDVSLTHRAGRGRRHPRTERQRQEHAGPRDLDPDPAGRRRGLASSASTPCAHPRAVQRMMNRVSVEASFFKKLSALREPALRREALRRDRRARPSRGSTRSWRGSGSTCKRAGEPMEHLSRGMQQKIALARALLTSPMLMLLDEPTTGLDPRSKKDVQAVVRDDPRRARRLDPALHPRHGRGRGALRPGRDHRRRRDHRARRTRRR